MFLKMSIVSSYLIFTFIGILNAYHPDIDINRIKLLPRGESGVNNPPLYYGQRSDQLRRSIDYGDHSSGNMFSALNSPHRPSATPSKKKPITIYQPREDPRFFYHSDKYIEGINQQNKNHEVSAIYPGRDIVRAAEAININHKSLPFRAAIETGHKRLEDTCVLCPHDRMLIAKPGSDHIILQSPHLRTCTGQKSSGFHFVRMYGPEFGSLLKHGSHFVVGRIVYKGKTLRLCQMRIQVVVQNCSIPKYLLAKCDDRTKICNFTCRNPKLDIHGRASLMCGDDMKWSGQTPVCQTRNWCEPQIPPEHGRISCQGATVDSGVGVVDGTACRVRCAPGWRWRPRTAAVCRRGAWTHGLTCEPSRRNNYTERLLERSSLLFSKP